MDLEIVGGNSLSGIVRSHGNKNAILPIISASILSDIPVILYNVPYISDVATFIEFLESINFNIKYYPQKEVLKITPTELKNIVVDHNHLTKMRASLLLITALALKYRKVTFKGHIGGCTLGYRPLDTFISNLKKLDLKVEYKRDKIIISSYHLLKSTTHKKVWQPETSVTATEAALLVASQRAGQTEIYNAASEPHVQDLCHFLQKLNTDINGIGTNLLTITTKGKKQSDANLTRTVSHVISSDHHEIITYLGISSLTKGNIQILHNLNPKQYLTGLLNTLEKLGVEIETTPVKKNELNKLDLLNSKDYKLLNEQVKNKNELYISKIKKASFKVRTSLTTPQITTIKPHPWPGFPVDLIPILIPIAIKGDQPVMFHNWMYEAGLWWANEIKKANVKLTIADPHRVIIYPHSLLQPANFDAPYIIRATIALAMLALNIKGRSIIRNADSMKRAHPNFVENLKSLGAKIKIVK